MADADATYTPERIRDISEHVYKMKLEQSCKGDVERMLQKDREADPDDNGKKLRNRAACYDGTTRVYLKVLGLMDN